MLDYAALLEVACRTIAEVDHATGKALGANLIRSRFIDGHDNDWIYLCYHTGLRSATDPETIELYVEFSGEWLVNANWPDWSIGDLDPNDRYPLAVSVDVIHPDSYARIEDPAVRARVIAAAKPMLDDIDEILARHLGWEKPSRGGRPQQLSLF